MKGTVLVLAAVLTFGSTALGMSGMAAEWTTAQDQGVMAAAPGHPGPAGQIWLGAPSRPLPSKPGPIRPW